MADPSIDTSAVPAGQQQSWGQFIKSLASFSGDLSALTAPSFILSPTSLIEFSAYWGEHPAALAAVSDAADPLERMLAVLRFYVSTLRGSYTARNTEQGTEKKPLNPVLGELFEGMWTSEDADAKGETLLVSEQVSHHPPITAYHLSNPTAGVSIEGHNGQKTTFSKGTIIVNQVGHSMLRVQPKAAGAREETYLITLPQLGIEGLWKAAPYVELYGKTSIASTAGYLATLEFSGKGYFSGKSHQLKATVSSLKDKSKPLYTVQGDWSDKMYYVGASPSSEKNALFWDATQERIPCRVKPIEEQGEFESRRLWKLTADGIRAGQYDLANKDKVRIENDQRARRKAEAEGTKPPHQLTYFDHQTNDAEYSALAVVCGHQPAKEDSYTRKTQ